MKRMLIAAVVLAAAASLFAQDGKSWPMYRGAIQDGASREAGWTANWPAEGPKVLWKTNVGLGFSAVSIANGKLYTMGGRDNKDTVWCLDAATGAEIWKFTYDCKDEANPGPRATPTIDGSRIYTVSRRGQVFCLEADSGKVVWQLVLKQAVAGRSMDHGYACSPRIFENLVILQANAKDGAVVAFDKADGKMVWKSGEGDGNYSTPVLYRKNGEARLAVFLADGLVSLDAKTGKQFFKFPYSCTWGLSICDPLVVGDKMFISAGYGGGAVLLDVTDDKPTVLWKTIEFSNQRTTSVLFKGYLFGIDGDNDRKPVLKCFDFATGKEMWAHEGLGNGSLMLAVDPTDATSVRNRGGKLIIQGAKGELVVAEATSEAYKEIARAKPLDGQCWTMPVLCGGLLYVRSHEGELVCLDVSGK